MKNFTSLILYLVCSFAFANPNPPAPNPNDRSIPIPGRDINVDNSLFLLFALMLILGLYYISKKRTS